MPLSTIADQETAPTVRTKLNAAITAINDHEADTANPHAVTADQVATTPAGGLAATDVQAALDELDSEKQPLDAELTALAGLTSAADTGLYFTGSGTAGTYTLTAAGRALLDDLDAAAQRVTLGLVIGTNVQAYHANLAALSGLTLAADKLPYATGAGALALTDLSAFARTVLDDADAAAARTTLGAAASGQPSAYATIASAQSIANASIDKILWDTPTMVGITHSSGTFTIPADGAGLYLITGQMTFASNATGVRRAYLYKNTSTVIRQFYTLTNSGEPTCIPISTIVPLANSDTVHISMYQTSGGALNTRTSPEIFFAIYRLP